MSHSTNTYTSIVTFLVSQQRYAIATDSVRSIIPVREMTYVPGAPGCVAGIINLRGDIIPVVGLDEWSAEQRDMQSAGEVLALVVEIPDEEGSHPVALVVDEVTQIIERDLSDLEDAGELLLNQRRNAAVVGVLSRGDEPILLLTPEKLIPEDREVRA